jgi:hypothetical protein
MTHRFAMTAAVLAAAFAVPASAQSFVGTWTATATAPDGPISEELTVTKTADGYSVTAKLLTEQPPGMPQAGPATDIKIEGDSFSYKRTIELPDQRLEINYSGTVSGDTFTGQGDVGGFSVPYNGVRKK